MHACLAGATNATNAATSTTTTTDLCLLLHIKFAFKGPMCKMSVMRLAPQHNRLGHLAGSSYLYMAIVAAGQVEGHCHGAAGVAVEEAAAARIAAVVVVPAGSATAASLGTKKKVTRESDLEPARTTCCCRVLLYLLLQARVAAQAAQRLQTCMPACGAACLRQAAV